MSRSKRRYTDRMEIVMEITRCQRRAVELDRDADKLTEFADAMFKSGDPGSVSAAKFNREMADKKKKSAAKVRDIRLKKLGMALAEFDTRPLPGFLPDDSVVLPNLKQGKQMELHEIKSSTEGMA